jgi:hypothetical protein
MSSSGIDIRDFELTIDEKLRKLARIEKELSTREDKMKMFIDGVREMRSSQKQYFMNRTPKNLNKAKEWERVIDIAIQEKKSEPDLFTRG